MNAKVGKCRECTLEKKIYLLVGLCRFCYDNQRYGGRESVRRMSRWYDTNSKKQQAGGEQGVWIY